MWCKTTLADVMSPPNQCIPARTTLQDSVDALLKASRGIVLVVDDEGHHVGILSPFELLRSCMPKPRGYCYPELKLICAPTAGTLARRGPILSPSHTIEEACSLLLTAEVDALPVVDHRRTVGIVFAEEVLKFVGGRAKD
jgi:CBS-domain-containing membrane protein